MNLPIDTRYKDVEYIYTRLACFFCANLPFQTSDPTQPTENKCFGPITDPTQPAGQRNPLPSELVDPIPNPTQPWVNPAVGQLWVNAIHPYCVSYQGRSYIEALGGS